MKRIRFILIIGLLIAFNLLYCQLKKDSVKSAGKIYLKVEQMPEFPGGNDALMKYVKTNMKYPTKSKKYKIQGTVKVKFVVNKDGKLSNIKIDKGIGRECDKEALRLVKSMPKWTPGTEKGEAVPVYITLPIKFMLK